MFDRTMTIAFSIMFTVVGLVLAGTSMQVGKTWVAAGFAALVLAGVAIVAYLHPRKN